MGHRRHSRSRSRSSSSSSSSSSSDSEHGHHNRHRKHGQSYQDSTYAYHDDHKGSHSAASGLTGFLAGSALSSLPHLGQHHNTPHFPGMSFPGQNNNQGFGQFAPPSGLPQRPPPPYVQEPPASGFRVPLTTDAPFPPDQQSGPPPCFDADHTSPVYFGSALFGKSVHPCKIAPRLSNPCRVPYGGQEWEHKGRYDLLPFNPSMMEIVPTSGGHIPPGRRPVEGGYEEDGRKLYHALAIIDGVQVPGKCAEHLSGANVPFGNGERFVREYGLLCWR